MLVGMARPAGPRSITLGAEASEAVTTSCGIRLSRARSCAWAKALLKQLVAQTRRRADARAATYVGDLAQTGARPVVHVANAIFYAAVALVARLPSLRLRTAVKGS